MGRPALPGWLRWLAPGLGVKRHAVLMGAGILALSAGTVLAVTLSPLGWLEALAFRAALQVLTGRGGYLSVLGVAVILLAGGAVAVLAGLRGMVRAVADAVMPPGGRPLVDVLARQRQRRRGPRVVVMGGGSGLSTLLRGLKAYTDNLTAVVTVFDDGGSSGRLRRELGVLPPGDIRDCLVALAESEPLLTRLFEYRFRGGALDGHAFGNLFIASLAGVTGDLETAIREVGKVLNIRGRVLPSAVQDVVLWAECADGSTVEGESQITRARQPIRRVGLRPADVAPAPDVLEAVGEADLIVLGPGSLYTSVIPHLLVRGVADAVRRSRAVRVYVCNVMTQPGETEGFTASDHLRALIQQVGPGVVTHAVVNTQTPRNPTVLARYAAEGAVPVRPDLDRVAALGVIPVARAVLSEEDVLRHDPDRLARVLLDVLDVASRARATG